MVMTAAATAHESFSIMLQERMDEELPKIEVRLRQLLARSSAAEMRAELNAKALLMRMVTSAYHGGGYSNSVDSDEHYLHVLRRDLDEFLADRRFTAEYPIARGSGCEIAGEDLARPFLTGMRRRHGADATTPMDATLAEYFRRLEQSMLCVAKLIAASPVDAVLEFLCASDMPDLVPDLQQVPDLMPAPNLAPDFMVPDFALPNFFAPPNLMA